MRSELWQADMEETQVLYGRLLNAEGVLQELLQILFSLTAERKLVVRLCLLLEGRTSLCENFLYTLCPCFAKFALGIVSLQCLQVGEWSEAWAGMQLRTPQKGELNCTKIITNTSKIRSSRTAIKELFSATARGDNSVGVFLCC